MPVVPRTIPIDLLASLPWEQMTADEKRKTWLWLDGLGDKPDYEYLQGDYDLVGSNRRYEIGE